MRDKLSAYIIVGKSRAFVMGIAILGVVMYHGKFVCQSELTKLLIYFGDSGVDIFLFISGFGVVHSLAKNSASTFFKNRLKKILPATYLYLIAYAIYRYTGGGSLTFPEITGWISLTGYWAGLTRQANWYIYTSMLLYALSPLLYSLLKESKKPRGTLAVLLVFAYLAAFSFWGQKTLMAVSRVPAYLLGFYAGMYWDKSKEMSGKCWIAVIASAIVGVAATVYGYFCVDYNFLRESGLFWYPYVLYGPAMVLILGRVYCTIKHYDFLRPVIRALEYCGKASLEILVTHIFVFSVAKQYNWIPSGVSMYNLRWVVLSILTVITACGVHLIIEWCFKIWERSKSAA